MPKHSDYGELIKVAGLGSQLAVRGIMPVQSPKNSAQMSNDLTAVNHNWLALWIDVVEGSSFELPNLLANGQVFSVQNSEVFEAPLWHSVNALAKVYGFSILARYSLDLNLMTEAKRKWRYTFRNECSRDEELRSVYLAVRKLIHLRFFHRHSFVGRLSKTRAQAICRTVLGWSFSPGAKSPNAQTSETSSDWEGLELLFTLFKAEAYFQVADILHGAEAFDESFEITKECMKLFETVGARKKANRSKFNLTVARGQAQFEVCYLADFLDLLRTTQNLGDEVLLIACYTNLSGEYESLGSYRNALKMINKALALALKVHHSSQVMDIHAQRVDLLAKLGRKTDALSAFEELNGRYNKFAEAAAQSLTAVHPWLLETDADAFATPESVPCHYWKDKEVSQKHLGGLGETLLRLLSFSPKSSRELIAAIYGIELVGDSSLRRFRDLMYRLQTRFPGLIIHERQKYRLATSAEQLK